MNEIYKARLGLIPLLAEHAPAGHIGRTALMKYMYFLQTLRGIPLGYHFSMYSYGPFDSDVLADLSSAEALNIVAVTPVQFSGGYGYQIQPGPQSETAKREVSLFLMNHKDDIEWLFAQFGGLNSAQLELASTIVYVNREFSEATQDYEIEDIVKRVSEIKPHFDKEQIQSFVYDLRAKEILTSVR